MSTVTLLGVGISTGFLATILFERLRTIVLRHRELKRQKPLNVEDVDQWLKESQRERRSADEEAYDFARQLVIKGRLWTDTPICVEGVTSIESPVTEIATPITEHAYVYIVIASYSRDSCSVKIFTLNQIYANMTRP
jgi:hypothetical protein